MGLISRVSSRTYRYFYTNKMAENNSKIYIDATDTENCSEKKVQIPVSKSVLPKGGRIPLTPARQNNQAETTSTPLKEERKAHEEGSALPEVDTCNRLPTAFKQKTPSRGGEVPNRNEIANDSTEFEKNMKKMMMDTPARLEPESSAGSIPARLELTSSAASIKK